MLRDPEEDTRVGKVVPPRLPGIETTTETVDENEIGVEMIGIKTVTEIVSGKERGSGREKENEKGKGSAKEIVTDGVAVLEEGMTVIEETIEEVTIGTIEEIGTGIARKKGNVTESEIETGYEIGIGGIETASETETETEIEIRIEDLVPKDETGQEMSEKEIEIETETETLIDTDRSASRVDEDMERPLDLQHGQEPLMSAMYQHALRLLTLGDCEDLSKHDIPLFCL